jgi:hypothetical protein
VKGMGATAGATPVSKLHVVGRVCLGPSVARAPHKTVCVCTHCLHGRARPKVNTCAEGEPQGASANMAHVA